MKIFQKLKTIIESYFVVLIISLAIGIFFAEQARILSPHVTIFLMIIFFLSALKIDLKEMFSYLQNKKTIFIAVVSMLIILPIIIYYVTLAIFPTVALAFLILATMPSGMTAPLLSEIVGGKQSLAIILAVITSLLAPVTIPLMIKILAGTTVDVSFLDMFISLAKVIFIPYILATIIKHFWKRQVQKIEPSFKSISIILLGLLIIGVVAKQADKIIVSISNGGDALSWLLGLFILFIVLHFVGYFGFFWMKKVDRITLTVGLTYMNFTLAVYLVDKFFNEPNVIIPIVLSVIPWSILIVPFRYLMSKKDSDNLIV